MPIDDGWLTELDVRVDPVRHEFLSPARKAMENFDEQTARELLGQMELAVMEAFKNKDAQRFTKDFAADYVGVSGDGVKDAAGEIKGMQAIDLDHLSAENMKIHFPAVHAAILTYTMITRGKMGNQPISGSIFASTLYINRDGRWLATLHTESMAR